MKKAIIGIISKHFDENKQRHNTYIRDEIKDAIYQNGAIPIGILPSNTNLDFVNISNEQEKYIKMDKIFNKSEKQNFIDAISLCDGIIIAGGIFGDTYEMFASKFCYDNDIPLLAICMGQNNVVRSLGGSTKFIKNKTKHLQKDAIYVHDIFINKDSLFYQIVKTKKMKVNSRHICTIDNPAMLTPSAYDDDGNIEVLEAKNKKFFLSVRFHPESLFRIEKKHNEIFKYFISACALSRKNTHQTSS